MPHPLVQSTGRRKQAIARVRLRTREAEGDGTIPVKGRAREEYFPSKTHIMILPEPLRINLTGHWGKLRAPGDCDHLFQLIATRRSD